MESMREMVQAQTSAAAELAASAEQMSKMSQHLIESTDRFILESDGAPPERKPFQGGGKRKPEAVVTARKSALDVDLQFADVHQRVN
jgi:hypothetical protein